MQRLMRKGIEVKVQMCHKLGNIGTRFNVVMITSFVDQGLYLCSFNSHSLIYIKVGIRKYYEKITIAACIHIQSKVE